MQLNRRDAPLELEIQSLLILHGSAARAAQELFGKYEKQALPLPQLELISTFCLHAGLPADLLGFLCKQISLDAKIPWGHFAEALALSQERIDAEISKYLLEGAESQLLTWHLARTHVLDHFDDAINKERELRRRAQQEKILQLKHELFHRAEMYRSQELDNEEGLVLEKILKMFPKDGDAQNQYQEYRSRKALRLLEAKASSPPSKRLEDLEIPLDKDTLEKLEIISRCMTETWEQNQHDAQMAVDFSVAHWMWDHPEGALPFLKGVATPSAMWLRAETLLKTGRTIELLSELVRLEQEQATNPDVTFAVAYLRAQALWALGRKFEAIEILESLVNVKPNYRSAQALLAVWKRGSP